SPTGGGIWVRRWRVRRPPPQRMPFLPSTIPRPGRATAKPWRTSMPGRKVIITCAVTGSIHTPSMSPHIPITPSEIAEAAIGAAEAGAAVVHLHARNPEDGRPDQSLEAFSPFL